MIINAIRFQPRHGKNETYLRFSRVPGAFRNFALYCAEAEQLEQFCMAVSFAFGAEHHKHIASASLNLIDADGHSWVIDRQEDKFRVLRNRKPLENPQQALAQLWDLDENQHSDPISGPNATHLITPVRLATKAQKLHGEVDHSLLGHRPTESKTSLQGVLDNAGEFVRSALPSFSHLNSEELCSLLSQLEPHYREWQEVHKQRDIFISLSQNTSKVDPSFMENLEEQIRIITEVEVIAGDLMDPNQAPQRVIERSKRADARLAELCTDAGLEAKALPAEPPDFSKGLTILSRLKLYENLEKASRMSMKKLVDEVQPVLKAYYETIDTFLKNDTQITAELQSCLDILTSEYKQSRAGQGPNRFKWLKNLNKGRKTQKPASETALLPVDGTDSNSLESSRMAVDYALGRLGELQADLYSNRNHHQEAVETMEDRHEKIVAEYGRLKYSWRQYCKKYNLSPETSIKHFLSLVKNCGLIYEARNEAELRRNQAKTHLSKIQSLQSLLTNWRQLTKSAKDAPLNNTSILLSETRALLDYAGKKRNQFSKLKRMDIQLHTHKKIESIMHTRIATLKQMWSRVFQEHGLAATPLSEPQLQTAFGHLPSLRAAHDQLSASSQTVSINELFSDEMLSSPVSLYCWKNARVGNNLRGQLIEALDQASPAGLGVLLIADKQLAGQLEKLPIATARAVAVNKSPPEQVKPSQPPHKAQQRSTLENPSTKGANLLNSKARQALEVLNPRVDKQQSGTVGRQKSGERVTMKN